MSSIVELKMLPLDLSLLISLIALFISIITLWLREFRGPDITLLGTPKFEFSDEGFDIKQNYTEPNNKNTSEINVYANVEGKSEGVGRYEQINISLKQEPSVVYLREATCAGGGCQIYIGSNESILRGEKGPGSIYRQMDYCTVRRRAVIERDNDTYSADLEVIAW